jgi:metallo-beta-lactamase class B
VEQLGFKWKDTKILLVSHAHFDHAAGSAEILKETGAKLEVMDGDVDVMESGGRTDFAFGPKPQFPAAHVDHTLHDNEKVSLGGITLVAHRTAGHTKGTTTWTMKTHVPGEPAGQLRNVVIVGSWSVLSEYRLLQQKGKPPSYPGIASDFTTTFTVLHMLPCDIFLAAHGSLFDLSGKLKRMPAESDRVWLDPQGYQQAVDKAQRAFEMVYEKEQKAAETQPR